MNSTFCPHRDMTGVLRNKPCLVVSSTTFVNWRDLCTKFAGCRVTVNLVGYITIIYKIDAN